MQSFLGGCRAPGERVAWHNWLADGFHRFLAPRAAGLSEFPADVRPGTERDALLFSISCNGTHGLPRTNTDKHQAVTLLLADAQWSQLSDREIARRCQVSHKFVQEVRRSASGDGRQMRLRKVRRGPRQRRRRAGICVRRPGLLFNTMRLQGVCARIISSAIQSINQRSMRLQSRRD